MNLSATFVSRRERFEASGNAQLVACIGALFGTLARQVGGFGICPGMNGDTRKA